MALFKADIYHQTIIDIYFPFLPLFPWYYRLVKDYNKYRQSCDLWWVYLCFFGKILGMICMCWIKNNLWKYLICKDNVDSFSLHTTGRVIKISKGFRQENQKNSSGVKRKKKDFWKVGFPFWWYKISDKRYRKYFLGRRNNVVHAWATQTFLSS